MKDDDTKPPLDDALRDMKASQQSSDEQEPTPLQQQHQPEQGPHQESNQYQQFARLPHDNQQPQPAPVNPQSGANNQPSAVGSQAVNPRFADFSRSETWKGIGVSIGIGFASALVLAIITATLMLALQATAVQRLGSTLSGLSSLTGSSDSSSSLGSGAGANFFQLIIVALIAGVSGQFSINMNASAGLFGSAAVDMYVWLPVGLSGIALIVGTAFGSFWMARRSRNRFIWSGIASSAIVGIAAAILYMLLGAMFPVALTQNSTVQTSLTMTITGLTLRTAFLAFLLAGLGALVGYALASSTPDADNVFTAGWRWMHRTRGAVRTVVESFAIYSMVFSIVAIIIIVTEAIRGHDFSIMLAIPLLFPALAIMSFSVAALGSVSLSAPGSSSTNISLWTASSSSVPTWVIVLLVVVFLCTSFFIALRVAARNMYDRAYAGWQHSWQSALITAAVWLIMIFFVANMSAGVHLSSALSALVNSAAHGSISVSLSPALWFFMLAALWAFVVEVIARICAPTVIRSQAGLWRFLVGGTVSTVTTQASVSPEQPSLVQPVPAAMTQSAVNAKPMRASTKRIILSGAVAVGIVAILGIAYAVMSSTIFSAKPVAEQYLNAIESGKYAQASAIANPGLPSGKDALLKDSAAKSGSGISHVHITSTSRSGSVETVAFTYTVEGKTQSDQITVSPKGSKYLIFKDWEVSTPLIKDIAVYVPTSVTKLDINGVTVSAKNASTSSGGSDSTLTFKVYPGVYAIKAKESTYVTSNTVSVQAVGQRVSMPGTIVPKATKALTDEINEQMKNQLDSCAESTSMQPEGCPFKAYAYYGDDSYKDVKWSIVDYPTVQDLSFGSGQFYSTSGSAKVTYQEKSLFDDSWESQDDTSYVYFDGTFTLDGDVLTVKFHSSGY